MPKPLSGGKNRKSDTSRRETKKAKFPITSSEIVNRRITKLNNAIRNAMSKFPNDTPQQTVDRLRAKRIITTTYRVNMVKSVDAFRVNPPKLQEGKPVSISKNIPINPFAGKQRAVWRTDFRPLRRRLLNLVVRLVLQKFPKDPPEKIVERVKGYGFDATVEHVRIVKSIRNYKTNPPKIQEWKPRPETYDDINNRRVAEARAVREQFKSAERRSKKALKLMGKGRTEEGTVRRKGITEQERIAVLKIVSENMHLPEKEIQQLLKSQGHVIGLEYIHSAKRAVKSGY